MNRMVGTYKVDGKTIEYSIVGNKGEPIFVMHGGHSSCEEEFGYASLLENNYRMITPSRAGYGKTSKQIGKDLSIACHYYIQLLNHLKVDKVHVLAISAGGPSGLYFAANYPDRVRTLTLQSAVTKEWHTPQDRIYKIAQVLFHPIVEKVTWKMTASMSNLLPEMMFKLMTSSFSTLSYKQIQNKIGNNDIEEVRKMNNRQRSGSGFLIDLLQTKEITAKEMSKIHAPTLIMHSPYDGAVPLEHPDEAHKQIRYSERYNPDTWGHLIWLGQDAEEAADYLVNFLADHS